MFRFIAAALLLAAPVQAHPHHEVFTNEGHCYDIATEVKTDCVLIHNRDYFIINDGTFVWTFTERLDMFFAEYYVVDVGGFQQQDDICYTSDSGIHCRSFSFLYGRD